MFMHYLAVIIITVFRQQQQQQQLVANLERQSTPRGRLAGFRSDAVTPCRAPPEPLGSGANV